MAFADGALARKEHERVAARIAEDPALRERLQPFVITRDALPEIFGQPFHAPIPERLVNTIRQGRLGRSERPAGSGFNRGFRLLAEVFFPAGLSLAHAVALAALVVGGFAAGRVATTHGLFGLRAGGGDVAYRDGDVFAAGRLAAALETAPSIDYASQVAPGSVAPMLTFRTTDQHGFCRQYKLNSKAGRLYVGFACRRDDGKWRVVFHSESTGGRSGAGQRYETASGPDSPGDSASSALEAAIDKFGDGARVETNLEAALLANGWHEPPPPPTNK